MFQKLLSGLFVGLVTIFIVGVYVFGSSPTSVGNWVKGIATDIGQFAKGFSGNGSSNAVGIIYFN